MIFHNVLVRGNTKGGAVELSKLRLDCAKPLVDTRWAILSLEKLFSLGRESISGTVGTSILVEHLLVEVPAIKSFLTNGMIGAENLC